MVSLIILLALGWLLYKALFPKVAPYYGKILPDDFPHFCQEGYGNIFPDPLRENPGDIFTDLFHPEYLRDIHEMDQDYLEIIEEPWGKESMFEDSFARNDSFELLVFPFADDLFTGHAPFIDD